MKKLTALALFSVMFATAASAEIVEAILVRVGDRIITRSSYVNRLNAAFGEIESNVPAAQVADRKAAVKKSLLNEMISELLLKDRADRLGLTVTDAEVQEATKRLMAQYGISSDKEFDESLAKAGLTRAQMQARLRDTLLTNKVFGRELRSREELSDKELRERYEREKERYRLPERARVRELVVMFPESGEADREALRARAAEAIAKAKAGDDFAALVASFSDAPTKEKGGDLGVVTRGELMADLDGGVFRSDAGAIVGPIETRFGYHILKVEERLPSEVPGFDAIKERLRREANEETYQRDYSSYIEKLRKEAYVEIFEKNIPS